MPFVYTIFPRGRQGPLQVSAGAEALPYMGYIGICSPQGYGLSAVLVKNRILILAILVLNRVWFLHSSLELNMFFRRSYFFHHFRGQTINKRR